MVKEATCIELRGSAELRAASLQAMAKKGWRIVSTQAKPDGGTFVYLEREETSARTVPSPVGRR